MLMMLSVLVGGFHSLKMVTVEPELVFTNLTHFGHRTMSMVSNPFLKKRHLKPCSFWQVQ
ncbi:hypothetical protein AZH46_05725 [Corynebacterium striatum]|nr:hypothetical protein AZH45_00515 [Corynebacterium striatum]PIS64520.1 hypothetical protein AZH44_04455 [Corynebacterium striatum]PIS67464.1 hypothetical protein AZH46_05725 [Corynebacterium striatum]